MKPLVTVAVLSATIFFGCSDSNKAQKKEQSTQKSEVQPSQKPKIEIVVNDNAYDEKVASQKQSGKDDPYYFSGDDANKQAQKSSERSAIDANLHVRSPYEDVKIPSTVHRMSKEFIVKCSACHSDYANGVIGPSLLGKSEEQIYKKIVAFKSGKSKNVLMRDLVKNMSDEEIRKIAKEIYDLNKQIERSRSK